MPGKLGHSGAWHWMGAAIIKCTEHNDRGRKDVSCGWGRTPGPTEREGPTPCGPSQEWKCGRDTGCLGQRREEKVTGRADGGRAPSPRGTLCDCPGLPAPVGATSALCFSPAGRPLRPTGTLKLRDTGPHSSGLRVPPARLVGPEPRHHILRTFPKPRGRRDEGSVGPAPPLVAEWPRLAGCSLGTDRAGTPAVGSTPGSEGSGKRRVWESHGVSHLPLAPCQPSAPQLGSRHFKGGGSVVAALGLDPSGTFCPGCLGAHKPNPDASWNP